MMRILKHCQGVVLFMIQLEFAIRIYLLVMLPLRQFTKHKSQASQENGEKYLTQQ